MHWPTATGPRRRRSWRYRWVDVVLVGKTRATWEGAHAGLVREAERSPAFRERLAVAARAAARLAPLARTG